MAAELAPWVILLALPIVLAVATAFTKASVVLGALRVGLGAEVLLPWSAMGALALVITGVVMGPVVVETIAIVDAAGGLEAVAEGRAWGAVTGPLLEFLGRHASVEELSFFAELQGVAPDDPRVLVPAFLVTELGEALHMAVLILLPLVIVDLVATQVLVLLGLATAPGPLVTLPLKLLLFLAVGGFDVVVRGLVEGYA